MEKIDIVMNQDCATWYVEKLVENTGNFVFLGIYTKLN